MVFPSNSLTTHNALRSLACSLALVSVGVERVEVVEGGLGGGVWWRRPQVVTLDRRLWLGLRATEEAFRSLLLPHGVGARVGRGRAYDDDRAPFSSGRRPWPGWRPR